MEQNIIRDEIEIDLKEIFQVLLSRLWFVIFLGVIAGLGTLVYSKYVIDPIYSSTTKVYVLNRQNTDANITYTDLQTGSQLTKDYVELVKSRTVLSQVVEDLDLDISTEALAGMITVSTAEDTRIITITVNSTDVYEAQKIADHLREVASAHIQQVMNLEAVNVVEEANVQTQPYSPNIKRNTILGCAAGLFIAVAIVLIMYLMDDSIRTPDDVERYLNVGVLASIPLSEMETKKKKKKHRIDYELPPEEYDDDDIDDDDYISYEKMN